MATHDYRSGWCTGSDMHEHCPTLIENGARAAQRYLVCACTCHYPLSDTARAVIVERTGHWGAVFPDGDLTRDVVVAYLADIQAQMQAPEDGGEADAA